MKNLVITIGREFGSGGHEIAKKLAEKLNVKFYDKELITKAAKENGMSEELFEKMDEKKVDSFWYAMAINSYTVNDSMIPMIDLPLNDRIYLMQSKVIEEIANKESCVIVGRSSNYILRNKENVVNVFIYANQEQKLQRIMKKHNLDEKHAKTLIEKENKKRESYYNHYTQGKWGERQDYNIMIDSSKLGIDKAVECIQNYIHLFEN